VGVNWCDQLAVKAALGHSSVENHQISIRHQISNSNVGKGDQTNERRQGDAMMGYVILQNERCDRCFDRYSFLSQGGLEPILTYRFYAALIERGIGAVKDMDVAWVAPNSHHERHGT
jgi:hypothetical protein